MRVERIRQAPRVTAPFSDEAWARLDRLGEQVDADLVAQDVRLTMGGEPTFVSIDDFEGAEWNIVGGRPDQARARRRSDPQAARALRARRLSALRPGQMVSGRKPAALGLRALLAHRRRADLARPRSRGPAGQARESRPRTNRSPARSRQRRRKLSPPRWSRVSASTVPTSSPPMRTRCIGSARKRRCRSTSILPTPRSTIPRNAPASSAISNAAFRRPTGFVLPIQRWNAPAARTGWMSGHWPLRRGKLFLAPGDSPVGLRLPLKSLPWVRPEIYPHIVQQDPLDAASRTAAGRRIINSPTAPRRRGELPAGGAGAESRRRRRAHRADRRAARRRRSACSCRRWKSSNDYLELLAAVERTAADDRPAAAYRGLSRRRSTRASMSSR